MATTCRQCKEWFQLIYQEVQRESNQKMLQTVAVDGQKIQVDIGKNESGTMLVLVLVRSVNYGRSGKISR